MERSVVHSVLASHVQVSTPSSLDTTTELGCLPWLALAWALDPDRDGLSIAAEVCIAGTDPARFDTDGGGTADGAELLALTDPLDPSDD